MMVSKDQEILCTIAANVYHFTGCGSYKSDGTIVANIEKRVKAYLSAIRHRAVKKATRKGVKINNLKPGDIYTALKGTPEFYGVRYCILWKKLKRKLEMEADDPMEIVDEETDALETVDVLQSALDKLNDGSKQFTQYVQEKEEVKRHADILTNSMTLDEYQQYHKKPKIKFTKEMLKHWLEWERITPDLSTIFAWLTVYKIRKIMYKATKSHEIMNSSLFSNEETQLKKLRDTMLNLSYFID